MREKVIPTISVFLEDWAGWEGFQDASQRGEQTLQHQGLSQEHAGVDVRHSSLKVGRDLPSPQGRGCGCVRCVLIIGRAAQYAGLLSHGGNSVSSPHFLSSSHFFFSSGFSKSGVGLHCQAEESEIGDLKG